MPSDRDGVLSRLDDVRDRADGVRRHLEATAASHPLIVLAVLATVLEAYAAIRVHAPLGPDEWPVLRDSVIFEYIGWHVAQGTPLYAGLWEVKPPLAFELTGTLALLAGGDIALYHTLNLAVTAGAVVATAVAAGAVVLELTDDPAATVAGGLTVFLLPTFYWRALVGFKSKYFVAAVGLLVLWLVLRERPLGAGVASAVCLGFWQLSVVFPVVALVTLVQRRDRNSITRFLAGGLATGLAVLLPVVAWNAVPAMVTETVLTPLLTAEDHALSNRIQFILRTLGVTIPVVAVGLVALGGSLDRKRVGREWPLVAATGWFALVMVFVDFDSAPDVFVFFALVAVGVGLAVGRGSGESGNILAVAVVGLAMLSVVTMGGYGTGSSTIPDSKTYDTTTELEPDFLHNQTERQYLFWNGVEPPTCRVFVGQTQLRVIKEANLSSPGDPYWNAPCGRFDPVWDAVVRKYT